MDYIVLMKGQKLSPAESCHCRSISDLVFSGFTMFVKNMMAARPGAIVWLIRLV